MNLVDIRHLFDYTEWANGLALEAATKLSDEDLFDIRTLAWSTELCDLLDVPIAALPEVRPSSGRFGVVECGIEGLDGVPISDLWRPPAG
jgi:glycerol kinase